MLGSLDFIDVLFWDYSFLIFLVASVAAGEPVPLVQDPDVVEGFETWICWFSTPYLLQIIHCNDFEQYSIEERREEGE